MHDVAAKIAYKIELCRESAGDAYVPQLGMYAALQ
jgi:hypothetical protein